MYVVDVIGGGKASRALVRKGRLRAVSRTTARPGWPSPSWTTADKAGPGRGRVARRPGIPGRRQTGPSASRSAPTPGRRPVVLSRGEFASLDFLDHQPARAYALAAGIHVEREALLTQRVASVMVRPGLTLNGRPVSVKLLEDVRLRVVATDQDGVSTSRRPRWPDFRLFEDRESVHEVRAPARLSSP